MFVYGDESGIGAPSRYCVVAGYLGSPREWRRFNREWKEVLDEFAVPDFHAKDFFGRASKQKSSRNPYVGWTDAKALRFIDALTAIIQKRRITPVANAVNTEDFKARTVDERRMITGGNYDQRRKVWTRMGSPNAPYHSALQWFYREAVDRSDRKTALHFVMDSQAHFAGYALDVFNATVAIIDEQFPEHQGKLSDLAYARRMAPEHLGLQAADLFAHLLARSLERDGVLDRERGRALERATKKRQHVMISEAAGMSRLLRAMRLRTGHLGLDWSDDLDLLGDADGATS